MSSRPLSLRLDEAISSGQLELPLPQVVARQGVALLAGEHLPVAALNEFARHDPVLVGVLFRAANSAFYQGLPKVTEIGEAIERIGAERATAEVQRTCVRAIEADQGHFLPRYLQPLWQHSLGCGLGASWLAERCGYQALAGPAHLAGLLHDIGKFLLLAGLEHAAAGETPTLPLGPALVEEVLASRHVAAGLHLHTAWNLPEPLAAVIGRHHDSGSEAQDLVMALVRLANQGCRKLGLGWENDPELVLPTTAEAQFLGLDEITLAEFEIMLEDHPLLTLQDWGDDGFPLLPEPLSELDKS
jgi:HD-like signal output (HDOD) protein